MRVNKIDKKIITNLNEAIAFNFVSYCFFKGIKINTSEVECLSLLSFYKDINRGDFCRICVSRGLFKSEQLARNVVSSLIKKGLIIGGKKISISIECPVDGNLYLDFKILGIEPKKSEII